MLQSASSLDHVLHWQLVSQRRVSEMLAGRSSTVRAKATLAPNIAAAVLQECHWHTGVLWNFETHVASVPIFR
jgi:predicted transcriptional regulator